MKRLLTVLGSVALLTACEQRIEAPAGQPSEKVVEKNTTIIAPPAEKKVEHNTTVVNPPAATEEKTSTTTTKTETKE